MVFPFSYIADYTNFRMNEAKKAFESFWGKGPVPDRSDVEIWQYYTEWLIFDFKLSNGSTFLIEYTLLNPDNLGEKIISRFKQIAQTQVYSDFQVLDIKKGEWLKLENIYTGKIYRVYDKSGSETIPGEGTIMARVAKVDDRWYLVGANSAFYPITYTERMKKNLQKDFVKNKIRLTPKDQYQLIIEQRKNSSKKHKSLTKSQLTEKRLKLEDEFIKKAEKYNAKMTFGELLKVIYNENRTNVLDLWIGLGKKGLTEKFVFEETQLLSDIWNHFPHKCLSGKAPIEIMPD